MSHMVKTPEYRFSRFKATPFILKHSSRAGQGTKSGFNCSICALGHTLSLYYIQVIALLAGFQLIGSTGNQIRPNLEVRVVLITCFSNIDYFEAGNQLIIQKW